MQRCLILANLCLLGGVLMADKKPSSPRRVTREVTAPAQFNWRTGNIRGLGRMPLYQFRRIATGKPGESVGYGPEKYDKSGLSPYSVRYDERNARYVQSSVPSSKKVQEKLSRTGKAKQARHFDSEVTMAYRQGRRIPESARPPRRKVSGPFVVAEPTNPVTEVRDKYAMRPGSPKGSLEVGRRGPRPSGMVSVPLKDYKYGLGGRSAYRPSRPIPGSVSEFRRMSGTPRMRRAIGRGIGSMVAGMGVKAAADYIAQTPLGRAIRNSLTK